MQEKENPLYQLIDEKKDFMKEGFILFPRTSELGANYYMLVPRDADRSKIITEYGELNAVGYHITVFDKLKAGVKHSTFHLTICLVDDNKKNVIARIFYKEFGSSIFYSIKDAKNNSINIGSEEGLLAFGAQNIEPFIQRILSLQQNYKVRFQELSNNLMSQESTLAEISECSSEDELLQYNQSITAIITHIKSQPLFNYEHLPMLKWYKKALTETEDKLDQIKDIILRKSAISSFLEPVISPAESESKKVIMPCSKADDKTKKVLAFRAKSIGYKEEVNSRAIIDELNEKITAISSLTISDIDKVVQEYELQIEKNKLLYKAPRVKSKKSRKSEDDNELLDTLFRCNQLLKQIDSFMSRVFHDETSHKKDKVLRTVLQNSSLKTQDLMELAVKNNRLELLELLLEVRNDFNLEAKTKVEKQYLLELAYNKGYLAIFQCLLAHKASPDILIGVSKQSILYRACVDDRAHEMEALLEAQANPTKVEANGFAPLGALLMRTPCSRNNVSMAKVFLTYAPDAMEQLQGNMIKKCTPLTLACQENDRVVIELLLLFGADPNNAREDNITAFGVCVYKENFELFTYLVEQSATSIRDGLFNALDMAVKCSLPRFMEYIIEYSNKHDLNLSIPSIEDSEYRLQKLNKSLKKYSFYNNFLSFFSPHVCATIEDISIDVSLSNDNTI